MKKLSGYFFAACMFTFVMAVSSCGKDGAAGPAGTAGETGPKGDKGDKGDQGDAGAANVIYSEWLNTTYRLDSSSGEFFVDIPATALTADVLKTAAVRVYMNFGTAASPAIVAIPYTEGFAIYIQEYLLPGIIELVSNANPSTAPDTNGNPRRQVRYVIIPGGTAARSAIDWNDYAKVKAYMGWKD